MKCRICGQDNTPQARFCANCGATLPVSAQVAAPETVVVEYAGFWIRFAAAIIDGVIVSVISQVLSSLMFWFLSPILPLLYYWLFTGLRGQTPGKMALSIKVVDAQGNPPTLRVAAVREIPGKLISTVGLCLGFAWIGRDKEKQGWHDKIASTHVVRVVKAKSME